MRASTTIRPFRCRQVGCDPKQGVVVNNRATDKLRGSQRGFDWPIKAAIERGYGVATFYYGDVEPDHIEGWRDGIRGYALTARRPDRAGSARMGRTGSMGLGAEPARWTIW